jgi:Natural resistance-associated macrophage protein-like
VPHVRQMRLDVVAGIAAGVAVMFAILVASAATLGAHSAHSIQTADQAAKALEPIAGSLSSLLFTAGIVGTRLLAIPTVAGSSAYALAEAFHWNEGLAKRLRERHRLGLPRAPPQHRSRAGTPITSGSDGALLNRQLRPPPHRRHLERTRHTQVRVRSNPSGFENAPLSTSLGVRYEPSRLGGGFMTSRLESVPSRSAGVQLTVRG